MDNVVGERELSEREGFEMTGGEIKKKESAERDKEWKYTQTRYRSDYDYSFCIGSEES
jgi:hypothetical protein